MGTEEITIPVEGSSAPVSGLFLRPREASALLVLAHGAGAGMRHPFLGAIAERLGELGIGTLRYQFPYMEEGRRYPNPAPLLERTVRSAVRTASRMATELPLLAGGKSLGGRMTSRAAAKQPLPGVHGLVFLGFPLHAPGKPGIERADHLASVTHPMLFLQGTRDALARRELIESVIGRLGDRASLHSVDGGDHTFRVPKRSGRTEEEVLDEIAGAIQKWSSELIRIP